MRIGANVRVRWAAIGAAVAVSVGAGGFAVANAALNPGPQSVFVAVGPCRLFDTRADFTVGDKNTPIAAGDDNALVQKVTGSNGNCTDIPLGITAIALNVTATDATAPSYLSVFPADATTPPTASNLNYGPGAPPTPNKVDVKVSTAGGVKFLNGYGTVNVFADVVGYYQNLRVGVNDMDTSFVIHTRTYPATAIPANGCIPNGAADGDTTGNGKLAAGKPIIATFETPPPSENLFLVPATTRSLASGIGVANYLLCSNQLTTLNFSGAVSVRLTVINK